MKHPIKYHETAYETHELKSSLLEYTLLVWLDYCHSRNNSKKRKIPGSTLKKFAAISFIFA